MLKFLLDVYYIVTKERILTQWLIYCLNFDFDKPISKISKSKLCLWTVYSNKKNYYKRT